MRQNSRRPTKVVTFLKNGDPSYSKTLQLTSHRYQRFDDLLQDLDKALNLPYGVRRVFTPDHASRVESINNLEDQGVYICAGFEKFKPMDYCQVYVKNFIKIVAYQSGSKK